MIIISFERTKFDLFCWRRSLLRVLCILLYIECSPIDAFHATCKVGSQWVFRRDQGNRFVPWWRLMDQTTHQIDSLTGSWRATPLVEMLCFAHYPPTNIEDLDWMEVMGCRWGYPSAWADNTHLRTRLDNLSSLQNPLYNEAYKQRERWTKDSERSHTTSDTILGTISTFTVNRSLTK